eukprot:gene6015-7493_t
MSTFKDKAKRPAEELSLDDFEHLQSRFIKKLKNDQKELQMFREKQLKEMKSSYSTGTGGESSNYFVPWREVENLKLSK